MFRILMWFTLFWPNLAIGNAIMNGGAFHTDTASIFGALIGSGVGAMLMKGVK